MIDTRVDSDEIRRLSWVLKALSHPTRLRLLLRIGEEPLCVQELQKEIGQSQANISQHLTLLRDRGLVVGERKGNTTCYRLSSPKISKFINLALTLLGEEF
ncbi:MAG: winged helix-turn-helix transcriptional regulator [Candidatus Atribacteria bacterium]|nr:winged helix-turn-helix transcriptional regulator [Candidatus Atribacteria bacterium]